MALLEYASLTNYVPQTELAVTYSERWNVADNYIETVRYATKRYAFVGMTYDAALKCYKSKQAQYMRKYGVIEMVPELRPVPGGDPVEVIVPTEVEVYKSGADVVMTHGDADSWSVEIGVNETDVRFAKSGVKPSDLFADCNLRNYDSSLEAGEPLEILSAEYLFSGNTQPNHIRVGCRINTTMVDWESVRVKVFSSGSWSENGYPLENETSAYFEYSPYTNDLAVKLVSAAEEESQTVACVPVDP